MKSPSSPRGGKIYLGDSVYAQLEAGMIRLSTNNGGDDSNVIFLERETMESLLGFYRIVLEGKLEPDND